MEEDPRKVDYSTQWRVSPADVHHRDGLVAETCGSSRFARDFASGAPPCWTRELVSYTHHVGSEWGLRVDVGCRGPEFARPALSCASRSEAVPDV